ncbi:HNH endonuclease [Shewanella xiamenensis]|uniref:HNH endonuclease n=1 Tax=Shewanella xiamenensis TaxID=332186 RepID=UPI0035B8546F
MNPYILTQDEKLIISKLKNSNLSPGEMWEHSSIKKLKSNIKKHYLKEQGNKCAYCQVWNPSTHGMVWDTEHIIDKDSSIEWIFEPQNLCVSCKDCNQAKGVKKVTKSDSYKYFPSKSNNYSIIHAHFDQYDKHIQVLAPGVTYRFYDEKGEKTIEVCGLLRYHQVGGRQNVDPQTQAILRYAADLQTPEAFALAIEHMKSRSQERIK